MRIPLEARKRRRPSEARKRSDAEGARETSRVLRAELVRRGITYSDLSKKLAAIGVHQSPESLRMAVPKGRFRALLLLQCLIAIGCKSLRLADLEEDC